MKGQFPWIGRSRGSAGGMTTSKVNDKNVMRAKAFEITNPKTAAQVMQRDFFKDVQEVCASVTEDQLRSLFGVKPKGMTRRNALSKQIAAAYTITNGVKSVDFSKLLAIGNGPKVTTPIGTIINGVLSTNEIQLSDFDTHGNDEFNLIFIVFNSEEKKIKVINSDFTFYDIEEQTEIEIGHLVGLQAGFCYITCSSNAEDVQEKPFGSFSIKTRATD